MMRRSFADTLHEKMGGDARIWVVTGDMGYKMWDRVRIGFSGKICKRGRGRAGHGRDRRGLGVGR